MTRPQQSQTWLSDLEDGASTEAAREAAEVVFLEGCAYELSVQLNSQ